MIKIAFYELKKLMRDTRWLILFLIQPIMVVVFLGLVTWQEPRNITISVYNLNDNQYSRQVIQDLENEKRIDLQTTNSIGEAYDQVEKDQTKSAVIVNISERNNVISGTLEIMENSTVPELSANAKSLIINSTKATILQFSKQNILMASPITAFSNQNISIEEPIKILETKNTQRNIKYFDYFLSALIVLLMIINCLNISSTAITTERAEGTFERFFVTPYKKSQMIFGKFLAFLLISIVLSVITIATLRIIFSVSLGSLWLVLLINFLTALVAIALGILISSITKSVSESLQVGVIGFYMTLILTPFLFHAETMYRYINKIALVIPFTYSINAMREVNILGFGIWQVMGDLLILLLSALILLTVSILLLRRRSI